MPVESIKGNFEIERLLKNIAVDVTDEQMASFEMWKNSYRTYESSWESFELHQSVDNATLVKTKIGVVLDKEDSTTSTLSLLFQQAPDPADAKGLWDAGQEKVRRENAEKNLIALKQEVTRINTLLKLNGRTVADFLKANRQPNVTADLKTMDTPDLVSEEILQRDVFESKVEPADILQNESEVEDDYWLLDALFDDDD